jgi:AcrR family transcriptional regulator
VTIARASGARKPRATYRHGDLRRALLDAGIALARDGGPDAVVLREATRRAGVVPNAAYRHFASRDELLQAVREAALAALALAMVAELRRLPAPGDAVAFARANLRAIGTAYVGFAQKQPGLFRTAFAGAAIHAPPASRAVDEPASPGPFQLLGAALDLLVRAGALPPARRPGAEYLAWSAVHGLSMLVIDGPLRRLTRGERDVVTRALLDMVEKGL